MCPDFSVRKQQANVPLKEFYSAREIAEMLNVSNKFVYRLIAEGHLTGIHIGRCVRVQKGEFEAWLAGLQAKE